MVIAQILNKMWAPVKIQFDQMYQEYLQYPAEDIERMILKTADAQRMVAEDSPFSRMTIIPNTGCPHWRKGDGFSGCSFCDNFTDNLDAMTLLSALKDKDAQRYTAVVCQLLERSRTGSQGLRVVENITAQDSLSDSSIPFEELLSVYQYGNRNQEMVYLGLETRAHNIQSDKLRLLKEKVCKRVMVECGMEVGNEWIRNHWLNKGITDRQLVDAIGKIHAEGCIASLDVLLGIPGLTPRQNRELFVQTFQKAITFGADYVIVSPLMRKKNNLQNVLYEHFRTDTDLQAELVALGDLTGIVDILSVYDALLLLLAEDGSLAKQMIISPVHTSHYREVLTSIYRTTVYHEAVQTLLDGIERFRQTKTRDCLKLAKDKITDSRFYRDHADLFENSRPMAKVSRTMSLVMKKMARLYFPDTYETVELQFSRELTGFSNETGYRTGEKGVESSMK